MLFRSQINGICEAKEDRMKKYLKKVMRLVKKFKKVDFIQIPREENIEADILAKEVSANETMDELDAVYAKYRPSRDATDRRRRQLDDPNSVVLEGRKASRSEG